MRNLFFRNYIMVAVLLVVSICTTFAQGTVSGVVKDDSGAPVVGAIVMVPNSTTATATDYEGKFTLNNVTGNTLEASFMGMTTESVNVAGRSYVEFTLVSDSTEIDDVVVIGYGAVKRADLTGSVSSVSGDELIAPGTTSAAEMMKGKAAGVSITTDSATPGGYNSISIRGQSAPLIVVDGIPQSSFSNTSAGLNTEGQDTDDTMISLNPDDIESIDILKDAASTAIYGANAAGGVILITTKSGKGLSKPQISYSGNVSFATISDYPTPMNAIEFMTENNKILNEMGFDARYPQEMIDSYVGYGTDWVGEVTRDVAVSHEHNFSIRNGTETTRYTLSGSYKDQDGVVLATDMNRLTARASLEQDINNWLTIGANFSISSIKYNNVTMSVGDGTGTSRGIGKALIASPLYSAYNANDGIATTVENNITSPYYAIVGNNVNQKDQQAISATGNFTLKPIKDLTIKGTFGYDQKSTDQNYYNVGVASASEGTSAYKMDEVSKITLMNVVANYSKVFQEKHNFSAMAGWEFRENTYEYDYKYGKEFARAETTWNDMGSGNQDYVEIASDYTKDQLASYFGRINYNFDSRYIITANLRVDGSSNFAANHQYGFFPGVSGAWRITQEEFLKHNPTISDLKLRASWGQVGYAGSLTGTDSTYSGSENVVAFNNIAQYGIGISAYGNPDLKWQTSTDITVGVDFGLFKNRLSGVVDLYQRITKDGITSKSLMSYNELTTIKTNSTARTRTRGIDITLSSKNINTKDFYWGTDLTFSYYRARTIERDVDWTPSNVYSTYEQNNNQIWRYKTDGILGEGESLDYIAGSCGGYVNILDLNGIARDDSGAITYDEDGYMSYSGEADGILDDADLYLVGYTTPIPFGITNSFTYKNWDMSIYIYGSMNGWTTNYIKLYCAENPYGATEGYNMPMEYVSQRWSVDNPTGTMPGVASYGNTYSDTDFCLEKSWYARLDNITIGYTFDKATIKKLFSSLRVYATARNICVITPYEGMDPETGGTYGSYPNARTFLVGANLNF